MGYVKKSRDFHEARWDEPFIMEMGNPGERNSGAAGNRGG